MSKNSKRLICLLKLRAIKFRVQTFVKRKEMDENNTHFREMYFHNSEIIETKRGIQNPV